jgi:hypothetical protein
MMGNDIDPAGEGGIDSNKFISNFIAASLKKTVTGGPSKDSVAWTEKELQGAQPHLLT